MQILIFKFDILLGLTYDENFHHYFLIGLLHKSVFTHTSLETRRVAEAMGLTTNLGELFLNENFRWFLQQEL